MTNQTTKNPVRFRASFMISYVLLLIVGVLALTVWPSLYRYDRVTSQGSTYPIRTQRFSGKTERLYSGGGWVDITRHSKDTTQSIPVPSEEVDKLGGELSIKNREIGANIYNGTDRDLNTVIMLIYFFDENGTECHQNKYELHTSSEAKPFASSLFEGSCEISDDKYKTFGSRIVSATWE